MNGWNLPSLESFEKEFLNALVEEGGYTEEEALAMAIDMGEIDEEEGEE